MGTFKDSLVGAGVWATEANTLEIGRLYYVDAVVTAALLDAGTRTGRVNVVSAKTGEQYKVRDVVLVGGGTNFGAGGDCTVSLTDGTTVWTTIANADLESAPAASLPWGNAKVPMTTTNATASAAGTDVYFKYASGTTAHTTGSITFCVCLERVA